MPAEHRPEDVGYVGLDITQHELERAPDGSYDSGTWPTPCAAAAASRAFDLVLSYQVIEHVKPLATVVRQHALTTWRPAG